MKFLNAMPLCVIVVSECVLAWSRLVVLTCNSSVAVKPDFFSVELESMLKRDKQIQTKNFTFLITTNKKWRFIIVNWQPGTFELKSWSLQCFCQLYSLFLLESVSVRVLVVLNLMFLLSWSLGLFLHLQMPFWTLGLVFWKLKLGKS